MFFRRGERERAARPLAAATEAFRALGMTGWLRRAASANEGPAPAPNPAREARSDRDRRQVFRFEGDYWRIAYDGQEIRVKAAKGLHDIAVLLMNPGKDVHVADLLTAGGNPEIEGDSAVPDATIARRASPGESSDALLDSAARAYRRRLAELHEELADAERSNDLGRATKTRQELDFIAAKLATAYGLGGRARKTAANPLERARKSNRLRDPPEPRADRACAPGARPPPPCLAEARCLLLVFSRRRPRLGRRVLTFTRR
jgi:hypothetical protein